MPRRQAAESVVKKGLPVPAAKDHHVAIDERADRLAPVIVVHDPTHRYGGHDLGGNIGTLQRITHRQRIHHCGQHTHVIAGHPIQSRLPAERRRETDCRHRLQGPPARRCRPVDPIASAIESRILGSIPKLSLPVSASPLSLSSIRLYFLSAANCGINILSKSWVYLTGHQAISLATVEECMALKTGPQPRIQKPLCARKT